MTGLIGLAVAAATMLGFALRRRCQAYLFIQRNLKRFRTCRPV